MFDLGVVVHDAAAEPAAEEGADAEREEGESHVGALLAGRGEAGNVFVVARLMNDFAEGEDEDGDVAGEHGGMEGENQPGERRDERADDDGGEGGDAAREDN